MVFQKQVAFFFSRILNLLTPFNLVAPNYKHTEKSYKGCLTPVKSLLEGRESGKPLARKDGCATVMDVVPSCQAEISLATFILSDCTGSSIC